MSVFRFFTQCRVVSLLIVTLVLISLTGCTTSSSNDIPDPDQRPTPKSTISGPASLLPWSGHDSYWLGANYAWYNYGTDFGSGAWGKFTDWKQIDKDFASMRTQGVRMVRWWVFADGRYAPTFGQDGQVTGLDPSVLTDLDQALSIAAKYKITLLLTLMDNSMWSAAVKKGTVIQGGHSAIVMLATTQQSYLDNALKPVLQHIAKSPYHAQVAAYDIVNEPEAQMQDFWGGSHLSPGAVKAFVFRCATYIHTYSNGGLATVGSATPYYVTTWKNLGLDFYQLHYYPKFDAAPALGETQMPGNGLPTYASLGLDKPCIVGEFATMDGSYGLDDTSPLSARWYLDTIQKRGYAGAFAWSYRVSDTASNWPKFQPVLTQWAKTHSAQIGP